MVFLTGIFMSKCSMEMVEYFFEWRNVVTEGVRIRLWFVLGGFDR